VRQVYLTYKISKDSTDTTNSTISFELLEALKGSVSDSSIKAGDFISFSVNLTNNDDNTIMIKEGSAFKVKASTIASQNVLLSKINITSDLELNSQNIDLSKYDLMTQIGNTNTQIKLLKYPTKLSGGSNEDEELLKALNSKYFKNYIFYDDSPRDDSKGLNYIKEKVVDENLQVSKVEDLFDNTLLDYPGDSTDPDSDRTMKSQRTIFNDFIRSKSINGDHNLTVFNKQIDNFSKVFEDNTKIPSKSIIAYLNIYKTSIKKHSNLVSQLDKIYSNYDTHLGGLIDLINKSVLATANDETKTKNDRVAYYNRVYKNDFLVKNQSEIINTIVNNFAPKKRLLEVKNIIENFVSKDIITGTTTSHAINYLNKILINTMKLQGIDKAIELIDNYKVSLEQIFVINNDITDNDLKIDFSNTIDLNTTKNTLNEYKTYFKNYNVYKDPVKTPNGIQKLKNLQQTITDKNSSSLTYIKHLEDFLYKDTSVGLIKTIGDTLIAL
jgi:hypothetical protein